MRSYGQLFVIFLGIQQGKKRSTFWQMLLFRLGGVTPLLQSAWPLNICGFLRLLLANILPLLTPPSGGRYDMWTTPNQMFTKSSNLFMAASRYFFNANIIKLCSKIYLLFFFLNFQNIQKKILNLFMAAGGYLFIAVLVPRLQSRPNPFFFPCTAAATLKMGSNIDFLKINFFKPV